LAVELALLTSSPEAIKSGASVRHLTETLNEDVVDMTLIACLHPRQSRTLLADVLISSRIEDVEDTFLPSRAYIPPERLHGMPLKPTAFRRKVIEITPELMILWAGEYGEACQLARRAIEWFRAEMPTLNNVEQFLYTHYREVIPNFCAIVAPAGANWFYALGNVQRGETPSCGEYAVAGSGTKVFQALADEARYHEGDESPDLTALRLTNDLLTKEISTGETIDSNFGAAYEMLYRGVRGFERVDDLMQFFSQITVDNKGNFKVSHYPHPTRQWYEEDRLYIASLSSTDAAREGLSSKGFVVPSVLGEEVQPIRPGADFATRPKYLCVHQQFQFQARIIPSTSTFRGDVIDRYLKLFWEGSTIRYEFTPEYIEMLREKWGTFVTRFLHGN
jgi:hypothetical protein